MGSSPDSQTVTQEATVPAYLQPLATQQAGLGIQGANILDDYLGQASQPQYITKQVQVGTTPTAYGFGGGLGGGLFGGGFSGNKAGDVPRRGIPGTGQPIYETRRVRNPAYDPNAPSYADLLVQPFDPYQVMGQEMAANAALGFDPSLFIDPALEGLTATAQGDYLYGGDAFDAAVQAAVRSAAPGIISAFGGDGTGGLAQHAIGQSAIDAFAGQYGDERRNMLYAQSLLPQLGNQAFGLEQLAPQVVSNVGAQRQAQGQQELLAPITAAQLYSSGANAGFPLSSLIGQSTTQPLYNDSLSQYAGLGLTALGVAGALFPPAAPAVAAGGFGGGLLGGIFG